MDLLDAVDLERDLLDRNRRHDFPLYRNISSAIKFDSSDFLRLQVVVVPTATRA
jgi:hypothetical protein